MRPDQQKYGPSGGRGSCGNIAFFAKFCLIFARKITEIMEITRHIHNLTLAPVLATRCEWVATAATLAGSALSSILGGSAARKAAKRAAAENTYRSNAEKAWYDKEYNTDYIDTKAGANLLRRAQEVQDNYVRKADGAAAVGGSSSASTAQAKESANKTMGDTIAQLGATDTARKQQVSDQHISNVQSLSRERQQIEDNKAQATSQAAQQMSNSLMSAGATLLGSELNGSKAVNSSELATPTVDFDGTKVSQYVPSAPTAEDEVTKRMRAAIGR